MKAMWFTQPLTPMFSSDADRYHDKSDHKKHRNNREGENTHVGIRVFRGRFEQHHKYDNPDTEPRNGNANERYKIIERTGKDSFHAIMRRQVFPRSNFDDHPPARMYFWKSHPTGCVR